MGSRYIDTCECRRGLLWVVRNKSTGKLILLCDSCYFVWDSPEFFYSGKPPFSTGFKVDIDRNISKEDIIDLGWDKYVKNMDAPIDADI